MTTFMIGAIVVICLSMIPVIFRMVKGPSSSDRVVALDSLGCITYFVNWSVFHFSGDELLP